MIMNLMMKRIIMIMIMLLMKFYVLLFEIKRVEGGDAGWISSTCVHCVHNVYSTAVEPSSPFRLWSYVPTLCLTWYRDQDLNIWVSDCGPFQPMAELKHNATN